MTNRRKKGGREIESNVLCDTGSTLSFITYEFADKLKLARQPVKLQVTGIGGSINHMDSKQYSIELKDEREVAGSEVDKFVEFVECRNHGRFSFWVKALREGGG